MALAIEIEPFFAKEAAIRRKETEGRPSKLVGHVPTSKKDKSRDRAASAVGLSGKTVSAAKAIKAASPERFEKIKQGTLTVAKAKKEVKKNTAAQHRDGNHLWDMFPQVNRAPATAPRPPLDCPARRYQRPA